MNNQQNKPQDNQKVEKAPKQVLENINNSAYVHKSDCIKAMKEYAAPLKSRIAELEAELRSIKDTIEKDPVSFILVHALKYLNNENKLVLLEKLGRRTNLTELEKKNEEYREVLERLKESDMCSHAGDRLIERTLKLR